MTGNGDKAALVAETLVVLPDAPSDLELRIDGGPPVWRSNGPVRLEPGADLSPDGFNQNGERRVVLTGALAALTGNPEAPAARTFSLELTSRTAGRLDLAAPAERRSLRHVWRAVVAGDAAPSLAFSEEGAEALSLTATGMPADAELGEIRLTVKGTAQPERIQPPVGPEPSVWSKSCSIRTVPCWCGWASIRNRNLSGLRLPLAVGPGGAQAVVALWSSTSAGEPDAPIASGVETGAARRRGGTLGLVRVRPAPRGAGRAVMGGRAGREGTGELAPDAGRGRYRGGRLAEDRPRRRAMVSAAGAVRPPSGQRLRPDTRPAALDGLPGKATPIAPVGLDAGLEPIEVTPSEAGIRVSVPAASAARALTVTALAAMTVTFAEIDLVTTG